MTLNHVPLTSVDSNPARDFGLFHVRKLSWASLWNVGGSTQMHTCARNNVRRDTWVLPITVKAVKLLYNLYSVGGLVRLKPNKQNTLWNTFWSYTETNKYCLYTCPTCLSNLLSRSKYKGRFVRMIIKHVPVSASQTLRVQSVEPLSITWSLSDIVIDESWNKDRIII